MNDFDTFNRRDAAVAPVRPTQPTTPHQQLARDAARAADHAFAARLDAMRDAAAQGAASSGLATPARETQPTRDARPADQAPPRQEAKDARGTARDRVAARAADPATDRAPGGDGHANEREANAVGNTERAPVGPRDASSPTTAALASALAPWLALGDVAARSAAATAWTDAAGGTESPGPIGSETAPAGKGKLSRSCADAGLQPGGRRNTDHAGAPEPMGATTALGRDAGGAVGTDATDRAAHAASRPSTAESRPMDFGAGIAAAGSRGAPLAGQAGAGPTPTASLPPVLEPIGTPHFAPALSERVALMIVEGLQHAQVEVNPPELGPVRIELSLAQESASVAFSAAQPDTRQAIEQTLPVLRDLLAEHGLHLADARIDAGAFGLGGGFGREPGRGDRASSGRAGRGGADAPEIDADPAAGFPRHRHVGPGRLDLFV